MKRILMQLTLLATSGLFTACGAPMASTAGSGLQTLGQSLKSTEEEVVLLASVEEQVTDQAVEEEAQDSSENLTDDEIISAYKQRLEQLLAFGQLRLEELVNSESDVAEQLIILTEQIITTTSMTLERLETDAAFRNTIIETTRNYVPAELDHEALSSRICEALESALGNQNLPEEVLGHLSQHYSKRCGQN